jgi:hypothetical protein
VTPSPQARARTMAVGLDGIAAVTAALVFDTRQLEHVLDDADCRDLARVLAHWVAESLTHAAAHGCAWPEYVLRQAGVRFSAEMA